MGKVGWSAQSKSWGRKNYLYGNLLVPWKGISKPGQGRGKDSLEDEGCAQSHFQKLEETVWQFFPSPPTEDSEPSVGGGLFAFGAWPAGGVVSDASQSEDQKDWGGGR